MSMVSEKTLTPGEVINLPLFGVLLEGDALAPEYQDGDVVVVARNVAPTPGKLVVMEYRGKVGCMRLNADGALTDNAGGFVHRGCYDVIGVVIEHHPLSHNLTH
ncbi:MAG: S24 family peptidase [Armatimonadota bacterium]